MKEEIVIKSSPIAISPKKMSLVASLIRKKGLDFSLKILPFVTKKGARILLKLLQGVEKNLNKKLEKIQNFHFRKIEVNQGSMPKKILYRAKGRSDRIKKNYCLVNLYIAKKNDIVL
jgi:large subunit ribosomal protein L22